MILKMLTRHKKETIPHLVRYILREGNQHMIFKNNIRARSEEGYIREILANEQFRTPRKNSIAAYHVIISFHADVDKGIYSEKMLRDIANKYMDLHGRGGILLGSVHMDTNHVHYHFIVHGLLYRSNRANRVDKKSLAALKRNLQDYHLERYPEITKSKVPHGQKKEFLTDKTWQQHHTHKRQEIKEKVLETVHECLVTSTTQKEFLEALSDHDIQWYSRSQNDVPTGIIVDNTKVRFSRLGINHADITGLQPDHHVSHLSELQAIRARKKQIHKNLEMER